MGRYEIDGIGFAQLLEAGAGNLKKNADIVNDLNVFPIPDGDTGSNMLMTIEGGLRGIQKPDASIGKTAAEAASGMLLGARGNSGVILSQIFAGVAKGLEGLAGGVDTKGRGRAMGGFAREGDDHDISRFGEVERNATCGQLVFEFLIGGKSDDDAVANGICHDAAIHRDDGLEVNLARD